MYYVEVLVGSGLYHGTKALTYEAPAALSPGTIVTVPLQKKASLGIVSAVVSKPRFPVKPVSDVPDLPPLPAQTMALLEWMRNYYPAPLGQIVQHFLPARLIQGAIPETEAKPAMPSPPQLTLTPDQKAALASMQEEGLHLLHGLTGTGKTQVYIELSRHALEKGRSVLILTPEIGLTTQLANAFSSALDHEVLVVHSDLGISERSRLWNDILTSGRPVVVIGPRSALFSPFKSLGLIVVDESHENAYKQDKAPYYHASLVAAKLGGLHHAPVVLGSATPLVSDYFLASIKNRPIIRMQRLAVTSPQSKEVISIIDLRDRRHFNQKPHLSNELIDEIQKTIERKEQVLLFLNRRGTARIVFCDQCGWQAACPHCDIPVIYHADGHSMRCHSCTFRSMTPSSCPSCHNASILFKSVGTKAIVEEVTSIFPDARIARFDSDNKKTEKVGAHYAALRKGDIDILVGTQTLAKGFDLPKLSLVGVIIADTSLYFPDFSAQEKTYQLLTQVVGRVGRGHRSSKAIVQTYNPDNPLLHAALTKDWESFYAGELAERKQFLFPPFCYLLKLTCRRATDKSAETTASLLAKKLKDSPLQIIVEGPSPAFHHKIQSKYQWQLVIKAKKRSELLRIIEHLPAGWSYDIDPMNLL